VAICSIYEIHLDFDTDSEIETEIRYEQLRAESYYRYDVILIALPSIRGKEFNIKLEI